MSFDPAQLSVLGYANGFTHWHYRSTDPLARILGTAYFAPAADMLRAGDQITLNLCRQESIGLAQCVVASLAQATGPSLALLAATPDTASGRAAA